MLGEVHADCQPVELFQSLAGNEGLVFLDSATGGGISILACEPERRVCTDDWGQLDDLLKSLACSSNPADTSRLLIPDGALIGAVDYEGKLIFGIYRDLVAYDHAGGSWFAAGNGARWLENVGAGDRSDHILSVEFSPELARNDFLKMVRRAQDYIAAGDIYQVNLAHRLSADFSGDPVDVYLQLREVSPAPYGAYLDVGERQIMSSSPELFLAIHGNDAKTRPIKGTRPRHGDMEADRQAAAELLANTKERAELLMITDLERNDLGKISEIGTIDVPGLIELESFEQVHHLVSTVCGRLRPEVSHVQAVAECSPGGSITGAPKLRAIEIIKELEPQPRGLYTGAIGYFGLNGVSQFNIAIRTMIKEGEVLHFHVGAGIVADSIAEDEYTETLDKAVGMLKACGCSPENF